jgi:hypothetical protein
MNDSLRSSPAHHGLPGSEASPSVSADIFDVTRALWPTRQVRVTDIIDLLQVTHAADRIDDYAAAMQRGERFPPIAVFGGLGCWFVADGHKRLSAYRQLGQPEILVECWPLGALLADLLRQAGRSWRRVCAALAALPGDRRPVSRLLAHTVAHWTRLARSLVSIVARRPHGG